jgi:hypothetical protein
MLMARMPVSMRIDGLRVVGAVVGLAALVAANLVVSTLAAVGAHASPDLHVFPGMEIRQDTNRCTLGFVDLRSRTAYSAGHCHGSGPVTDKAGNVIGQQVTFQDNTPNGATIATDHVITDWETIALLPEVSVNDVLPSGRSLIADPAVVPVAGQRICHFGVVTGESCGTVDSVNNGWFTMTNGVVSQRGDSGGPVYVQTDDGRAAIVGMFNSTWGQFPAAVSWQATDQQARSDVFNAASGTVPAAAS